MRRKCFISYHHTDQKEVDNFIRDFDLGQDCFIACGLGNEMPGDVIQSEDTDYVMRRIRELYSSDSTITLLVLEQCTWARRYVNWELQSPLRSGENKMLNGILGIKLPRFDETKGRFTKRFNQNLRGEAESDCYAHHIKYPVSKQSLANQIEAAFECRKTHANSIKNPHDRMLLDIYY